MNKATIECTNLIGKYKLCKEDIIKQLEMVGIKREQDVVIACDKDFRFTLIGETKDKQVILTNIEKTIAFRKMDNLGLFKSIKEQEK